MAAIEGNTTRKRVHIIYNHDEHLLAEAIKQLVENHFAGCDAYAFKVDAVPGRNWLDTMFASMERATAFVTLLSPRSIRSQWVIMETAAAWALSKRTSGLIPVLHSGLTPRGLPEALHPLQALDASSESFVHDLFYRLAQKLQQPPPDNDQNAPRLSLVTEALTAIGEQRQSYDLFVSAPRTRVPWHAGGEAGFRKEVADLIRTLPKSKVHKKIYPDPADLEGGVAAGVGNDMSRRALRNSARFTLIWPAKIVSSCLAEVGAAQALRIPCVLWVRKREDLPVSIQHHPPGTRIEEYTSLSFVAQEMTQRGEAMFAGLNEEQ